MASDCSLIIVVNQAGVICIRLREPQVQGGMLPQVAADCIKAIAGITQPRVVFDFEGIEYFPSTGLGTLIEFKQAVHDRQGELRLCSMQPHIRELFRISGLTHVFPISETQAEAIGAFQVAAAKPAPK